MKKLGLKSEFKDILVFEKFHTGELKTLPKSTNDTRLIGGIPIDAEHEGLVEVEKNKDGAYNTSDIKDIIELASKSPSQMQAQWYIASEIQTLSEDDIMIDDDLPVAESEKPAP